MDFSSKILAVLIVAAAMMPALLHAEAPTSAATKAAGVSRETELMFANVCKKSKYPEPCIATMSQNPNASSATTVHAVAAIVIAELKSLSREGLELIRRINESIVPESAGASNISHDMYECTTNFEYTFRYMDFGLQDSDVRSLGGAWDQVESFCEPRLHRIGGKLVEPLLELVGKWKDMFFVAIQAINWANAVGGNN